MGEQTDTCTFTFHGSFHEDISLIQRRTCATRPFQISAFFLRPHGDRPPSLKFHRLSDNWVTGCVVGLEGERVDTVVVVGTTNAWLNATNNANSPIVNAQRFIIVFFSCCCGWDWRQFYTSVSQNLSRATSYELLTSLESILRTPRFTKPLVHSEEPSEPWLRTTWQLPSVFARSCRIWRGRETM